jgi:mRNA interferase MazF
MNKSIKRGDLYYADLNPVVGSEQGGIRPVLVTVNEKISGNLMQNAGAYE